MSLRPEYWIDAIRDNRAERAKLDAWLAENSMDAPLLIINAVNHRIVSLRDHLPTLQNLLSYECDPWFERQDTGRFYVYCVDASGSGWDELRGFHYPCAAFAAGARLMRERPPFTYAANFTWMVAERGEEERGFLIDEDDYEAEAA